MTTPLHIPCGVGAPPGTTLAQRNAALHVLLNAVALRAHRRWLPTTSDRWRRSRLASAGPSVGRTPVGRLRTAGRRRCRTAASACRPSGHRTPRSPAGHQRARLGSCCRSVSGPTGAAVDAGDRVELRLCGGCATRALALDLPRPLTTSAASPKGVRVIGWPAAAAQFSAWSSWPDARSFQEALDQTLRRGRRRCTNERGLDAALCGQPRPTGWAGDRMCQQTFSGRRLQVPVNQGRDHAPEMAHQMSFVFMSTGTPAVEVQQATKVHPGQFRRDRQDCACRYLLRSVARSRQKFRSDPW